MFWDKFWALCIKSGKSPNGVAKELKIPSGSITAWKNGSVPRSSTLVKIASYFDVPISALTVESDQKEKSPTPEGMELSETKRRLIERIMAGSDDQADFVLGLIDRMK